LAQQNKIFWQEYFSKEICKNPLLWKINLVKETAGMPFTF
jgi:hypothetical protein